MKRIKNGLRRGAVGSSAAGRWTGGPFVALTKAALRLQFVIAIARTLRSR